MNTFLAFLQNPARSSERRHRCRRKARGLNNLEHQSSCKSQRWGTLSVFCSLAWKLLTTVFNLSMSFATYWGVRLPNCNCLLQARVHCGFDLYFLGGRGCDALLNLTFLGVEGPLRFGTLPFSGLRDPLELYVFAGYGGRALRFGTLSSCGVWGGGLALWNFTFLRGRRGIVLWNFTFLRGMGGGPCALEL